MPLFFSVNDAPSANSSELRDSYQLIAPEAHSKTLAPDIITEIPLPRISVYAPLGLFPPLPSSPFLNVTLSKEAVALGEASIEPQNPLSPAEKSTRGVELSVAL